MTFANVNLHLDLGQAQTCGGSSQEKEEIKTASINIIFCRIN